MSALVAQPAPIDGLLSWTIETRVHRGRVLRVEFSPDGRYLASAGFDGCIRIWEADTGKLSKVIVNSSYAVYDISWAPDAKFIAATSTGIDGAVKIWQVESGRLVQLIEREAGSVAWSPDGKFVAIGRGGSVSLWDVTKRKYERTIEVGTTAVRMKWSPDGQSLAVSNPLDDAGPAIWNSKTGNISRFPAGDTSATNDMDWSHDSQWLLSADGKDGIRIWNVERMSLERSTDYEGQAMSVAISPNEENLVVCGDNHFVVENLETGATKRGSFTAGSPASSIDWSDDGSHVATGHHEGMIHLIDANDLDNQKVIDSLRTTLNGSLSPDGKSLITSRISQSPALPLEIWDVATGQRRQEIPPPDERQVGSVAWHPERNLLAAPCDDFVIRFWDFEASKWSDNQFDVKTHMHGNTPPAWSPDGRYLASPGVDGIVRIQNTENGEVFELKHTGKAISSIAWSHDSSRLATSELDQRSLRIWNVESAETVKVIPTNGITHAYAIAWYLDDRTVAASGAGSIVQLSDVDTGKEFSTLTISASGNQLFWLAVPQRLVSIDQMGQVRIWDTETFQLESQFDSLIGDGTQLNTLNNLLSTRILNVVYLKETGTTSRFGCLIALHSEQMVAISPEGHYRNLLPMVEKDLVYVALTESGQETFSPVEFNKRFGWKNDPTKVYLVPKTE